MEEPIDCKRTPAPTTGVSVDQRRRWNDARTRIERTLNKPLLYTSFALTDDKKHERLILQLGEHRVVIESRHARGGESYLVVTEPK